MLLNKSLSFSLYYNKLVFIMTKAIPYLLVKNGKEAISLYEGIFNAKLIEHMPFDKEVGSQMGIPDDFDYENSTMHAKLEINGALIYLADNAIGPKFDSSGNVEVTLDLETQKQIETFYNKALKAGSTVKMPLEKTFWGAYFARFEDPQGIGWQLNYSEEQ